MAESLRCSACQNGVAERCDSSLDLIQAALVSGDESTLAGRWQEITVAADGSVSLTPARFDIALQAQAMLGTGFLGAFIESQRQLGCNLSVEELEIKLMTEQA